MAGVVVIGVIVFMTIFPGSFTSFSPMDQNAGPQMAKPSAAHFMGTDNLGRDVGARMVYGARTILGVAIAASILSALIGIPLGLISGFAGNWLDKVLSLVMDSVYSFPGLILAIAFAAMLGPGVINITVAVSVVYIPTYFRLVRGPNAIHQGRTLRRGRARHRREAERNSAKYIFPNVIATVVVVFSLNVADAIMTEAALSYIGLGLPAGIPDWGMDLSMGKKFLPSGVWWMITYPGTDDHDPRPRLYDARRGSLRDPQPQAAGVLKMADYARETILEIEDLSIAYPISIGTVRAVEGISLTVRKGEVLGIVGESGCGKSTLGLSILKLMKPPGRITSGSILYKGNDILTMDDKSLLDLRGGNIAMIFQNPLTSLDPLVTVQDTSSRPYASTKPKFPRRTCVERAEDILADLGIEATQARRVSIPAFRGHAPEHHDRAGPHPASPHPPRRRAHDRPRRDRRGGFTELL